jgi:hypothetical protein
MFYDSIPLLIVFLISTAIIVGAVEVGFRLGDAAHRRSEDEKESPVSAITGTILGLLAFILAFTFAIASDRYDARKVLVREEADAIRTAYTRADFLPQPDRGQAQELLSRYLNERLDAIQSEDLARLAVAMADAVQIQHQLWDMAVLRVNEGFNTDIAALYAESLNTLTDLHAQRVTLGLQARMPPGIWLFLLALLSIGMLAVGYQTAISGSRRSWAALILAVSFSLVIVLIAALDRPQSSMIPVSQQPLENVKAWIAAGAQTP